MNLKLLSKLQGTDSVNLILKSNAGDILDYYLIARSVSYSIVCSGHTTGTIPSGMVSFDIRMSSVIPLIEKGLQMRIRYTEESLQFVTEDEKTIIAPSYVESNDVGAMQVLERYIKFSEALANKAKIDFQIETISNQLSEMKRTYQNVSLMALSGGPSSDPFGELPTVSIDKKYIPLIEEKENQLNTLLSNASELEEINLGSLLPLASAASRGHYLVDMCGDYAIVSLKSSFMLQKTECPVQSIQGQLLFNLLRDGKGKGFYSFDDDLIYLNGDKDQTVVFVERYLPSNNVDSSIVTRGAVEEKYSIKLKSILDTVSLVKSHFSKLSLDMGNAEFILSNELGESIRMKFEVQDAKTIALAKAMRDNNFQGSLTMATIDIPSDVQTVLNLFRDELTIYVKRKKIIFQNRGLYLVFGR